MAETFIPDSDYIDPLEDLAPVDGPGDKKPKKKKETKATEPEWAKGKTAADLPIAPSARKPRKPRDFSAQEKALINYADNDNVINQSPNTSSGTGGVSPMYLMQIEQDRSEAKKKQRELQQNVDFYNAHNNDYVEDFVNEYFGGVDDILKGGNKFSQFIINTNTGLQVSDEAIKRLLDTEIKANGGGNYTSSLYYSQIKGVANQMLGLWNQRDAANKELNTIKEKYDPKAYEQAVLEQRSKLLADGKTQVETARELSNQKISKIQTQYEPVIADLGMDINFYYKQTAEEVGNELTKQTEGISGVSPTYIQNRFEQAVQERFTERYGAYVQENVQPVVDAYVDAVNEEIGKANKAVKRITNQQTKSFLTYKNQKTQEFEQTKQKAEDEAAGIINKYIQQGVTNNNKQRDAFTGAMMYMSATPTIGASYTGSLFGNSLMAGWGRLRTNTATFLKSVGFEADWIDEMQYGGTGDQQKYNMGNASLGEFGLTPGYWAKALGESAPTMVPGILLSAVTRNPYVGMIVGGISEGADLAGGITNQIADETGDWGKAAAQGREAFLKNIPTYFLEAPLYRLVAGVAGKTAKTVLMDVATAGVSGGAQEWLQTGAIELPATEGKTIIQGLADPQAVEAGVAGFGMEVMMGGGGAAFNTILSTVPNARTQALTNSIVRHGMKGAVGAAQQEAFGQDQSSLEQSVKELENIHTMMKDAQVLNLPVPQTQVYTALRQELSVIEQKAIDVKDPVLKSMVEKQAEEKKQEIEKVVRGEEPLATIELPMGLVFTGTIPQIGEILQIAEIKEGIANGQVKIESTDKKLMKEVGKLAKENIEDRSQEPEVGQYDDLVDALVMQLPKTEGLYGKFLEQVTNPDHQEFVAQAVIDQYQQDFEAASGRYGEDVTKEVVKFVSGDMDKSGGNIITSKAVMEGIFTDKIETGDKTVNLPEKGYVISGVSLNEGEQKGKGSGQEIYKKALDEHGVLYSAFPISEDAMRVHDKLVEKGIAKIETVKLSDGTELRKITKIGTEIKTPNNEKEEEKGLLTQTNEPATAVNGGGVHSASPAVSKKKPKKVKLSYRQRTNNLVDLIAKARSEKSKTTAARMINDIKLEIASINKSFPNSGYKLDQKAVRLYNKSGNQVKKKNEVTNKAEAKDFNREDYSADTNAYINRIAEDETLAIGLAMTGIDGRRLSVEQMQGAIESIRKGKVTEAGRELFDYIEQAVNDGTVEIEDASNGMKAKISVDEYFAAAKEVEQMYNEGTLPMSEEEILSWQEDEAANNYEEETFDNVDNLPSYEQDITTTGNNAEQQYEAKSSNGENSPGQEGANPVETSPADDFETGRKEYLSKVGKDFDIYNLLPKKKRPAKLNAMSRRLQAAKRDGVITEEDFNDVQNRINADYEALGSDVRVEQIAIPDDVMGEFEGEGEEAKITNKEKAKEVADKIRSMRVANDKLYGGFLGLPIAAYNGFLSAVALTIEGSGTIADAIKNGYEAVKPYLTGEKFTEKEVKQAIAAELQNLGIAARKKNISPKKAINEQLKDSPKTGVTTFRELFKRRIKTEKDMGKIVNKLQQAVADIFRASVGTDLSKGRIGMVMEALKGLTNMKDPELALLDVLEDIDLIVQEQETANLVNEVNTNLKKLQKQFKRSGTLTDRYKNIFKSLIFPRAKKVLLATGAATLQQYNDLLNELTGATSGKQLERNNSIEQVQNKLNDLNKLIADYDQQRLYDKIEVLAKKNIFSPVLAKDGTIDFEQSAEKYLAEREAEGSELEKKAAATKEEVLKTYLPQLQKEVSKEIENIEDKRLQKEAAELVKVDTTKLDATELSELNDLLNNILLDHYPDGVGNFLARINAKEDMQKIVSKASELVVRPINKETLEKKSLNALFQSLFYNEKAWSYFRSVIYQPWATAANRVKAAMNGDKRRTGIAEEAERIVKKHKLGTLQHYRTEMYKFINRYNPSFPESREEQQQAAVEKLVSQIHAIYAEGVRNMNGKKETFDSKKMKAEAIQQAEAAKTLGIIHSYTETGSGLEVEANEDFVNDISNLTAGERVWVEFTYNKFQEIADDAEYSARSNFGQDFQKEEAYTPFIPIRISIDNNAAADSKVDGSISTFTDFGKKLSKQPTDRFKKRGRLAGEDMYYGMNGLENFYNGYYQTLFAIEGGRSLIQTTSIINGTEFAKFVNGSYNPVFGEKNFGRGEQAELVRSKLSQVYKGYKYAPFKFTTTQDYEHSVGQWVYSKMLETMVSSIDQIFKQPLPGIVQATIDIGPKYVAHALRIISNGFASREQADILNRFFDNTSEEFRDAQSLDSFHKVVDEQNSPAWQSIANVPFTVFNYVGKKSLIWADKQVLNRILLMGGYLKGLQENGNLGALSDFNLEEAAGNIDMLALSTAEGAAQRINATSAKHEKADVVKMGQHKNWWEFGYTLRGFQLDAWNNFRNNLAIAFDRSGYLGAADPQRFSAFKRASAYLLQSAAYQGLVIWGTGMAWTALGQLAAEALMGAPPPDNDEKEKEKNTRRILRLGSNVVSDAFLGGQSVYVDAGAKVLANKLWESYQDAYRNIDGGKSKDYKGGILDTRLKPFYVDESQAAGPMAALRYIDGVLDAVKETKNTGMNPKARQLKDQMEKVQLVLLVLNAGDLQKLNSYTIRALNDYGKQKAKPQGMRQNMMNGGMLKAPKF